MVKCIKDYIKNLNIVIWCNIWCPYCYARTTAKRFHSVEDFNIPTFFENKLRLIDSRKDKTYFLTAQCDLSWWSKEWTEKVFKKISENKNKTFIFQTKRPELIKLDKTPDNWWFWITITSSNEKCRIKYLKENIKAKHYLITFEPMFDNIWGIEQKLDLEKGKYHQKENGYLISIIKPISYEYQYLWKKIFSLHEY